MVKSRLRRIALGTLLGATAALVPLACASRGPDLASRMAAAKSAYESVGMAASGPTAAGALTEGKDTTVPLKLEKRCYQIVAFAGEGLKGIEVALQDPAGKPVGTVSKQEGQSSVKHCIPEAGTYTLVVKSTGGSGSFLAQPYTTPEQGPTIVKGDGEQNPDCVGDDCPEEPSVGPGGDPCSNPLELSFGNAAKSTTKGKPIASAHASCAFGDGAASVYRVHVEGRHKIVADASGKFDLVLGLFRSATDGYLCDTQNEVECSDDAQGSPNKAHLEAIVNTGDYALMVTGYDNVDSGDFELKARLEDAPSLESVCSQAHVITPGSKVTELLGEGGSNFEPSCASTSGSEALFKMDLKSRSRVRLSMHAGGGGDSNISVRKRCEDNASEVACARDWHFDGIAWTGLLDAGGYTVIADSNDVNHAGNVDLTFDASPISGAGTAEADTCATAKNLPLTVATTIDTFQAKSDLKASCAADGSADVVYKVDVKVKSRIYVSVVEDEGRHVVAIQKACGETKGEVACETMAPAKPVEATLEPGTWYIVVKGKGVDDFGRAKINARVREIGTAPAACKAAPKLVPGTPVTDTTLNAPDRFASEKCGGSLAYQSSGDKVYQFTLKEKSKVNLTLKNSFYNAIMSLRQDCNDPIKGELVCSFSYSKTLDRDLDPGTYFVVVDGTGTKSEGNYTLEMNAKPIK
jgi:hypothetical protein